MSTAAKWRRVVELHCAALRRVDTRPESVRDPVHRDCIGPHLARAADNLAVHHDHCLCSDPRCVRGLVELEAWHYYWSITSDARGHDLGDEDAATQLSDDTWIEELRGDKLARVPARKRP